MTDAGPSGGEAMQRPRDETAMRALVLARLGEVSPDADLEQLDWAVNFRDQMDFDSVDLLNLILALERALHVKVPEADYPQLSSLDGCTRYLLALAGAPETIR